MLIAHPTPDAAVLRTIYAVRAHAGTGPRQATRSRQIKRIPRSQIHVKVEERWWGYIYRNGCVAWFRCPRTTTHGAVVDHCPKGCLQLGVYLE